MTKKFVLETAIHQLALDFNASPEDFRQGIRFTSPALRPGRRAYQEELPFFRMVTVGNAAVVMAAEEIQPALKEWAKGAEQPHWLFELPRMVRLGEILAPYGYSLSQTFHLYLPKGEFPPAAPPAGLSLRWLEREDIQREIYPNQVWHNALHPQELPQRPDMLALVAMDGEKPAAMAGASADTPNMWQVGIDVSTEYRGRGLGTLLVQSMAREIQRRGVVPFYGTSLSNLHSQNIGVSCGFFPAWVEVDCQPAKLGA